MNEDDKSEKPGPDKQAPKDEHADQIELPMFDAVAPDDAPIEVHAKTLAPDPILEETVADEPPPVVETETARARIKRLAPLGKTRRPFRLGRLVWRLFLIGVFVGVIAPVALVTIYRWVPPPFTILMVQRLAEGRGMDYRWRSISKISPSLVRSAIAAEDGKFCEHNGFDFNAIEKAMAHNERRPGRIRGGSTISQQTAKNVFLWPQRSWVRKGLEAYYTVLIETIWGKQRIMEVYLNVIEMGPGTYGAQAASRRYFGVDASQLQPTQAARLIAILPSPLKYKAVQSGPYVQRRVRKIGGRAGAIRRDGLASCVLT